MGANKKTKRTNNKAASSSGIKEEIVLSDEELQEAKKRPGKPFSILGNLIFLITIAIIFGIGYFVWQTWLPQDLSTLPGYKQAKPEINIPELLREADKKHAVLTLSESDVNRYIASTLKASQHGIIAPFCKPSGVGIRFHEGYMEVIIERQLASANMQTVSLFVTVIQEEDPQSPLPRTTLEYRNNPVDDSYVTQGGTIGSLSLPQGYVIILKPAFENLASAYEDLLSTILDSGRIIQIREGYVDLSPGRQTF